MTISDLASLGGIIFGLTGAILGSLSYFRDKIKVDVLLRWDMKVLNVPRYDERKNWGIMTVTNVGRRTVFTELNNLPNYSNDYPLTTICSDYIP